MTDTGYIPDPALVELVADAIAIDLGLEPWQLRPAARAVLSALAAEGRLLPGPLLAVHTNDGRVYHPSEVKFAVGPRLPVPDAEMS